MISYEKSRVKVRSDIPEAETRAWERLAKPGTWWTGAERVAIAAEVRAARDCALCLERLEAVSPEAAQGQHDGPGTLPEPAIDVIHRLSTDPGRLAKSWFEKVQASGIDDGRYVEIVGVVTTVMSVDFFCRGLGVPLHPLPEPQPGEPSRYRPDAAKPDGAWIPMISAAEAMTGPEADLFGGRSRTGNVIRAMSLVPDEVRQLNDLSASHYLPIEDVGNPRAHRALDRAQTELLAGRVSALNECFY